MAQQADIAIVGGGLAGGLTALAIARAYPDVELALIEAGDSFGGNHRWSWFPSDLRDDETALLSAFPQTRWDVGYEVRFPAHSRILKNGYRSLVSRDFDATLRQLLPQSAIMTGRKVTGLSAHELSFSDGTKAQAERIIDCRDFAPSHHLNGGWQIFLGQHIRTQKPHGQTRPIIMDAAVEQHGAFRFVYSLPLSPTEIFVEDTYYADKPVLDRALLADRVQSYAETQGWQGEVIAQETGILPVITSGDLNAHRGELERAEVALAGARGLFTHPLTSYTVPIAASNALTIAEHVHLPAWELAATVHAMAHEHWSATAYYRALGRMLFDAADPDQRYLIFERFYRLRESLIERFYAARSTRFDKMRILTGRPPVAISRAVAALLGKGTPLVQSQPKEIKHGPESTGQKGTA